MTVRLQRFAVLIGDETNPATHTEHEVTILAGDQMRAELEAPRHGLTSIKETPQHHIALWIWAALSRTGRCDQPFQVWKPTLLGYDEIKADHTATPGVLDGVPTTITDHPETGEPVVAVDPTLPVRGTEPPSSWPHTSATYPGGSIPPPIPA